MKTKNEKMSGKLELQKTTIVDLTMPVRSGVKVGCLCCSLMSGTFAPKSGPTCPPEPPPGGKLI